MQQTANLNLPYIMPSQAQKHVTHNEAIRSLDSLVQLAILDRDLATPPGAPAEGDRYLVAVGGTGTWAGRDGEIAAWQDGAWAFLSPRAGWLAWLIDEARLLTFDGSGWIDAAVHSINPAPMVGINAIADETNRLSVSSAASLFDQEGGDHRMKINKAASGDTASVLLQSGYSGRAEFGLAGNDDWSVKVSPDGTAWVEAITVDAATGRALLPAGLGLEHEDQIVAKRHIRELLSANRTYYVRSDGSDTNTGLANSTGGAFLTLQKAANVVFGTLDLSGYSVTVQVADGTYGGGVTQNSPQVGAGDVSFVGNTTTPANCLIHVTSGNPFLANGGSTKFSVDGFELRTTTSGNCVEAVGGAVITIGPKVNFGPCATRHVVAARAGQIIVSTGYAISGGASAHFYAENAGIIFSNNDTFVLSGTPAFSSFCQALTGGNMRITGATFSGTGATGMRYNASGNAVVNTNGGGASYFPGSGAGATASGGQYL